MMILTAAPGKEPSPAASISVLTEDQAETDRLWAALTDGGEPGQCGWATDRFGISWQVVPKRLPDLLASPDAELSGRVMQAMMKMTKIDIAALDAAAIGRSP
ncbi:MAG: VOC family protein [Jannaschia sp.]